MNIRVLLCDDHEIMRASLRALILKEPGFRLLAEAADGQEAARLARELAPDVVVMDVAMLGANGMVATQRIRREAPSVKVLALSMHADRRFVSGMFAAGASGYLLKDCAFTELANAIRATARGERYLCPGLEHLRPSDDGSAPPAVKKRPLTAKEREVLQAIAEGLSTKEIAAKLGMAVKTAESHRQHIMDKLGLHSVAELTKYALREGLTSIES